MKRVDTSPLPSDELIPKIVMKHVAEEVLVERALEDITDVL